MAELVGFLDTEGLVVAYLYGAFDARGQTAPVGTRIPTPRPDRLVRVSRTGGARRDIVTDLAHVTVECWDAHEDSAFELARLARALVAALPSDALYGRMVRHVGEIGGPVYHEDPETDCPRYQFTVALEVRGEVIV